MRRTILSTIVLILVLFSVSNAQVIEGDVTLTTQAEVNSFAGTSITGNLTIQGSDIVDLTPLSTLTTVGGEMVVGVVSEWEPGNAVLTNLEGLSNLTTVGGSLYVHNNDLLTDLDGLSNLTSVGGLVVGSNASLTNLDGLSNLTSMGLLAIFWCDALTNLEGLSNLTSVSNNLEIWWNASLTNLDALSNLASVGSDLQVVGNDELNIFCGLYPLLSSNGLSGSYTVGSNLLNPTQQQIIDDGPCATTALVENEILPKDYNLHQNYPNPFNPTTTTSYDLPEQSTVSLTVYDLRGQEVMTLQGAEKPLGNYEVQWNGLDQQGSPVSTGVYFARLQAGVYSKTIKMVYLR